MHTQPKGLRLSSSVLTAFLLAAMLCDVSVASVFKKGGNIQITNLDMIDDDLYAYGNRLTVDGRVTGDLTAFVSQTTINGEIGQSAYIFSQNLEHNGKIDGSLRAFAFNIAVNGFVTRSVVLFAMDVKLTKGSVIERDATIFGGRISIDGTIKGNATIDADVIEIAGVITGDVNLKAKKILIIPPAVITGNLTYTSRNQAEIDSTSGVTISGRTTWNLPKKGGEEEEPGTGWTKIIVRISSLLAAFLFGIIIAYLFRPYVEEAVNQVRTRFTVSVAAGLLGVLILIVSVVVFALAVASLIAGFLLVSGDLAPIGSLVLVFSILMLPVSSFASISGGILFYSGKIIIGFWLGYLIMQRAKPASSVLSKSALFLGLLILSILFIIPVAGTVFYLAAAVIGAGGIMLGIKHCRRGFLSTSTGTPPSVPA